MIHKNTKHNCGFTLIELLTVTAVIAILVVMVVPSLSRAKVITKWRLSHFKIMQIDGGCEMYKSDFGSWPMSSRDRAKQDIIDKLVAQGMAVGTATTNAETMLTYVPTGLTGKELITLFLTGYGPAGATGAMTNILTADGCEGFGYKVIQRGQQWGPYGGTDNIATKVTSSTTQRYFVDAFDNPILYYLYIPSETKYDAADNATDGPAQAFLNICASNYRTSFTIVSKGAEIRWPALPLGNDTVTNLGIEK